MLERNVLRTRSGVDLFVRDWGSGPPVLLLAGWGMTSDLWASVMLRLCEAGLRAITFDRRGHGQPSDPGVVSYDLLADDLADVMDALDCHRVWLWRIREPAVRWSAALDVTAMLE